MTIYTCMVVSTPVNLPGQPGIGIDLLQTDDAFWHVFDFSFIAGKPYDRATFDAGQPVAVITESVARRLFQTSDAIGREFLLNHAPYKVAGVVRCFYTGYRCLRAGMGTLYFNGNNQGYLSDEHMGMMSCTIHGTGPR